MRSGFSSLRCGLLGEHLGHSFSPRIHASLCDYTYDLVERAPEEVEAFLKEGGYDAFNVTIPYKKAVIPFLDRISPEAEAIGAVNTVVRRADGSLDGYNTDYFGFETMLSLSEIAVLGKKALVLGSGGASSTVQAVLRDRGAREVVVIGRSLENNYGNLDRHADAEIIVNTTPVGMYPKNGDSPVDLSLFPHCCGVLDVIYNPARTALILDAEARGIPAVGGLPMLVAQAIKAFEYFTGEVAEDGAIERIVRDITQKTKNVILIGMPSCGKSTVGKLLAETLCRPFYDADDEFTSMHGITPADAITTLGENRFREMEHEVILSLGKESGAVIACGGGVVTREENYRPLHQNGIIVYLRRELSKLVTGGRPLSQKTSPEALYMARKSSYERFADLCVDSTEVPEHTAEVIRLALSEFYKGKDLL